MVSIGTSTRNAGIDHNTTIALLTNAQIHTYKCAILHFHFWVALRNHTHVDPSTHTYTLTHTNTGVCVCMESGEVGPVEGQIRRTKTDEPVMKTHRVRTGSVS